MNPCVLDALGGTSNVHSTNLNTSFSCSVFSSILIGQAVKLLAFQLPIFGDTVDKNVEICL